MAGVRISAGLWLQCTIGSMVGLLRGDEVPRSGSESGSIAAKSHRCCLPQDRSRIAAQIPQQPHIHIQRLRFADDDAGEVRVARVDQVVAFGVT